MRYIKRDIESKIEELSKEYACILVSGPRQVGKTTVLKELSENNREYITFDDLEERRLAQKDPAMFLQIHKMPMLIDEVQYAPEIFSYIKIAIDNGAKPGSFWITGSQSFKMMELAQESLAGRVALLHMTSLSQHEIYGIGKNMPFTLELKKIKSRLENATKANVEGIYERIWNGSLPGLVSGKFTDRDIFYSSYLQTYIERDITDLIGKVDKLLFSDFIRSAACRVGQVLNVHDIAKDVGIADNTAKRWLQILEKSDVIFYLRPYSNNLLKRTIKSPKLYFFDTGLVAYLTKYSSPEILSNGSLNGAILENYVVTEILKTYRNEGKEPLLWYYRDRNDNEIDMVIEADGKLHPIEIKKTANPGDELIKTFSVLEHATMPKGERSDFVYEGRIKRH